jgi:hypothetical protein
LCSTPKPPTPSLAADTVFSLFFSCCHPTPWLTKSNTLFAAQFAFPIHTAFFFSFSFGSYFKEPSGYGRRKPTPESDALVDLCKEKEKRDQQKTEGFRGEKETEGDTDNVRTTCWWKTSQRRPNVSELMA